MYMNLPPIPSRAPTNRFIDSSDMGFIRRCPACEAAVERLACNMSYHGKSFATQKEQEDRGEKVQAGKRDFRKNVRIFGDQD